MNAPAPEFSRLVAVDRIPPTGVTQELEAKPAERAALARRFDLVELKKLTAQLSLVAGREQIIRVKGEMQADIVQSCVVTLDPVASRLTVDIDMEFIPAGSHAAGAGSPNPLEPEEEYETYIGGRIDLGEMLAQHLGTHLDPYPRKPGATLPATEFGAKEEKTKPLAQLATLARKPKNKGKS